MCVRSLQESLENFKPVISMARENGINVRGYVSTAFGCPYEGKVPQKRLHALFERLVALDAPIIYLADTTGVARIKYGSRRWPMMVDSTGPPLTQSNAHFKCSFESERDTRHDAAHRTIARYAPTAARGRG